jgi:hypothetical protein
MLGFNRSKGVARRTATLALLLSAFLAARARAADVSCPTTDTTQMAANYLAEVFDLRFCWQSLGAGSTYVVETSTNRGSWVPEATVTDNNVSLRRDLGERLQVRLSVCQGSVCSAPSAPSKLTFIWRNYDADGSGRVTIRDYNLLRALLSTPVEMRRFKTVFGFFLVNGRYLEKLPT